MMGIGVIVRDHHGLVRAVHCRSQRGLLTPSAAEALACLLAIQLCSELGFQRVHLEGDSKGVIDAVLSSEKTYCREGHLIDDIKTATQVLYQTTGQWKMEFVRRDGNCAAHTLAKYAVTNFIGLGLRLFLIVFTTLFCWSKLLQLFEFSNEKHITIIIKK